MSAHGLKRGALVELRTTIPLTLLSASAAMLSAVIASKVVRVKPKLALPMALLVLFAFLVDPDVSQVFVRTEYSHRSTGPYPWLMILQPELVEFLNALTAYADDRSIRTLPWASVPKAMFFAAIWPWVLGPVLVLANWIYKIFSSRRNRPEPEGQQEEWE